MKNATAATQRQKSMIPPAAFFPLMHHMPYDEIFMIATVRITVFMISKARSFKNEPPSAFYVKPDVNVYFGGQDFLFFVKCGKFPVGEKAFF